MTGVVFDPSLTGPQKELLTAVRERNLWAVLDPRFMELATPSGFTDRRAELPWAGVHPHRPQELSGAAGEEAVRRLVDFIQKYGFTAVLSPSHYLAKGHHEPWFAIDLALTRSLRRQLDVRGCRDVGIYYALAVPTSVLNDAAQRTAFKAQLQNLGIDGVWLRVHPFGADSGHVNLHRYIHACRDLHGLNLPLVAEKVGSIGIALLAFGAVSGVESGVSSGDKFDFSRLAKVPKEGSKGFAPHPRVYLPALGLFLDRETARSFFEVRGLKAFGCTNSACCRRGPPDTLTEPRRHYVFTRMEEVAAIGRVPNQLRAGQYLETMLRPATDRLGRAMQAEITQDIQGRLERERRKLDGWRHTLGELSRTQPVSTVAVPPERRIARRRPA
jgi:hypothetical protein